jgi:glycogen(starch) synthase
VSEPFGLTPFEAMRYQVPVIVSKQTGAAELLPKAVQVDFWDIHAMAQLMLKFCEDKTLSQGLREQQSHTLGHMTWKSVAQKLTSIYRRLIPT